MDVPTNKISFPHDKFGKNEGDEEEFDRYNKMEVPIVDDSHFRRMLSTCAVEAKDWAQLHDLVADRMGVETKKAAERAVAMNRIFMDDENYDPTALILFQRVTAVKGSLHGRHKAVMAAVGYRSQSQSPFVYKPSVGKGAAERQRVVIAKQSGPPSTTQAGKKGSRSAPGSRQTPRQAKGGGKPRKSNPATRRKPGPESMPRRSPRLAQR